MFRGGRCVKSGHSVPCHYGVVRRCGMYVVRRELRQGGVEQVVYARAVFGGDREDWGAKAMEDGGVVFLRGGVDFIDGDHERLAGGSEQPGEFFVERREAGLAVDDENEQG